MSENAETFRKFRTLLGATVDSYNNICKTTRRVEFQLIEKEIARIDSLVFRGEQELCWKSDGVLEYIEELGELVEGLWKRIKSAQMNVERIKAILEPWTRTPLIERRDRRKDALLSFDERPEKVSRRYAEVEKASGQIHSLLEENRLLYRVSDEIEEPWQRYVAYVDGIAMESLRRAVGCSLGEWFPCFPSIEPFPTRPAIVFFLLGYLVENMDPNGHTEPLLEAKLELREPDLYYIPSLEPDDPDGLDQLILALLNDIIGMAALVPRIKKNSTGYAEELEDDPDIKGMKNDIMNNVANAIEEATEFCSNFEGDPKDESSKCSTFFVIR